MDPALLAALAQPDRLQIVELLAAQPRSVGEVADRLGLRQPQATKHLQTLADAGLVTVHPLGQRRIYALHREPLLALRAWLDGFEESSPDEDVLERYTAALEAERARGPAGERRIKLVSVLPATPIPVWRAWTTAEEMRRWWAPRHFEVVECEAEPVAGGRLAVVLAEADGTRHVARGRYMALDRPRELRFRLDPLGPDGKPLFRAEHRVLLTRHAAGTRLAMTAHVTGIAREAAAPALAGMRVGWEQSFAKLAEHLRTADPTTRRRGPG